MPRDSALSTRFDRSRRLRLAVYLSLPCLLLVLTYLAGSLGGTLCLFQRLFDLECPACGATRAAYALLRFDFADAFGCNPLFTAGVYPAAALLLGWDVAVILLDLVTGRRHGSPLEFLLTGRCA